MIKQAIIPLDGLGTRLLPLTSVIPKQLLTIKVKPGLEYILDECIKSGIKEIILIISVKKKMIKNYFNRDNFYKKIIKKNQDKRLIKEFKKIKKYRKMIKFIYQNKPLGRGDALMAMTYFGAYANFEEKEKGSIEPGKVADFVILDTDLIIAPENRVKQAKVVATFIDGNLVFSRRFN